MVNDSGLYIMAEKKTYYKYSKKGEGNLWDDHNAFITWRREKMLKLKKVYVQDINPDVVVQTIQVVLPSDRKIAVEPIKDCGQFYLPAEL